MTDIIKCQTHLKNTQLLFLVKKINNSGNYKSYDQLYVEHQSIRSRNTSDNTLLYISIWVASILLLAIAATITAWICLKNKPFKFNPAQAQVVHAESETKLQNMIKPGEIIDK